KRSPLQHGIVDSPHPAERSYHQVVWVCRQRIIVYGHVLAQELSPVELHMKLVGRVVIAPLQQEEQLAVVALDPSAWGGVRVEKGRGIRNRVVPGGVETRERLQGPHVEWKHDAEENNDQE